uniref:DUF223 domain-containing protein n=2 Tax=Brassica TaxID=3705 RepID=A0A0D3A8Y9_BRAOL
MGRDVPRLPYGIHNHPQEKINPTTYLSNFLGCYMIFLVCVLLFKEGYYMASWPGWTALDIWRAGRDEPRLPYGELAKADHARHMASWPGRGSSPSSTYGEPVGLGQTSAFLGWFGRFGSVDSVIHGFIPARRANYYMSSLKAGSIVKVDRFEVVRCSSMYKITDHLFLIRFIPPTIIDEVITDAPKINLQS